MPDVPADRYASGDYLAAHPTWHAEDSAWKAGQIHALLVRHGLVPATVVEVGSGAGGILVELQRLLPGGTRLQGWEISPQAHALAAPHANRGLSFFEGDFLSVPGAPVDLLLAIDVVEHVENPFDFVRRLRPRARWKLLHLPLDLSALGVARSWPLLTAKSSVGHLSYYTRDLAVALLRDTGYRVIDTAYTSIQLDGAGRQVRMRGRGLRRWLHRRWPDATARMLGGFSLLLLAE